MKAETGRSSNIITNDEPSLKHKNHIRVTLKIKDFSEVKEGRK